MQRQILPQRERARQLLASEGDDGVATAAGRVYDKLHASLDPLVGAAGVRALFARSAKVAHGAHACLADATHLASALELQACLKTLDPAVAMETALTLFGTFLAIVTNFIGERLTLEALRAAWPAIDATRPTENKE